MPDLASFIPKFDGSFPVQDFLREVEDCQELGSWSDLFTLKVAQSKLTGPISELLRTRFELHQARTFSEFSTHLLSALTVEKPLSTRLHHLLECTQNSHESVDEYATRLRFHSKLLVEYDVSSDTLAMKNSFVACAFVRGLCWDIRQHLLLEIPETFSSMIVKARTLEQTLNLCSRTPVPVLESVTSAPCGRRRRRRGRRTARSASWKRGLCQKPRYVRGNFSLPWARPPRTRRRRRKCLRAKSDCLPGWRNSASGFAMGLGGTLYP